MATSTVDEMEGAVTEAACVLSPGGYACIAISHPLQGIGDFSGPERQGPHVLARPYFEEQRLTYWTEHDGAPVALHFKYRPLATYCAALEQAGLLIESLREPAPPADALRQLQDGEQRRLVPSFLHIRAIRR